MNQQRAHPVSLRQPATEDARARREARDRADPLILDRKVECDTGTLRETCDDDAPGGGASCADDFGEQRAQTGAADSLLFGRIAPLMPQLGRVGTFHRHHGRVRRQPRLAQASGHDATTQAPAATVKKHDHGRGAVQSRSVDARGQLQQARTHAETPVHDPGEHDQKQYR
jgi:hypothetical protein